MFSPIYLNRAFYCTDDIEKLKWVTVFLVSQLHLSALQLKPFNPILGETLQLSVGDLDLYYEQVLNKPPTCTFLGISKNYKIEGNLSIEAKTGANSIKAQKLGNYIITFPGGYKYELIQAQVYTSNITVGKRMFNFRRTVVVVDHVIF